MMKKSPEHFSDNEGLTLIELLISIALLGVVLTLATTMLVQSLNVIEPSMKRMSAGQLTELAKSELSTYLRTATTEVSKDLDDNGVSTWEFTGYHPTTEDAVEIDFTIKHSDENRNVSIESAIEDRTLVSNVEDLEINNIYDKNSFEIFIRVIDREKNEATKRATVRSRNPRSLNED